jgi:translation initiation factor 3 subunit H
MASPWYKKQSNSVLLSLQKHGLSYRDIFVEIPIIIRNSSLLNAFLHQLPAPPSSDLTMPTSLADFSTDTASFPSLNPNRDALDLSIDPVLEKTCDLLLDSIETHNSEINNHQYYQRQLAREQAKITAWQTKRKTENQARVAAKQTPLPEDEWTRLFKLPQEPSRLDNMLNSRQIEQYSRQIDGFTANVSAKMFAVKSNLLPGDSRH